MRETFLCAVGKFLQLSSWFAKACFRSGHLRVPAREMRQMSRVLMRSSLPSFAACILAAFFGCSKPETSKPREAGTAPTPSPAGHFVDVCSLLTPDEIRSIQGELPETTQATTAPEGELSSSQCFFKLPTFAKSISLQVVARGNKPGSPDAKEAWNKIFPKEDLQERETEAGKTKLPPKPIPDLGEAALWTGGPTGGLYVLQGSHYLRLSVGGGEEEEVKIKKSITLARLILPRL